MKKEKPKWAEMTKKQKVIHIIDCIMKSIILIIVGACVVYGIVANAKGRDKAAKAYVNGGDLGISTPSNGNDIYQELNKKYAVNHYKDTTETYQVIMSLGDIVSTESATVKLVKNIETDVSPIRFYNSETKKWDEVHYFDCSYGIYDRPNHLAYTAEIWAWNRERGDYLTGGGFVYYPEYGEEFPSFEETLIAKIKPIGNFDLAFNYKEPVFDYENTQTGDIAEGLSIEDYPEFFICKALMSTQNSSLTSDKIYSDAYTEGYNEGETTGYENGYNNGYNLGKEQATSFNPIGMMIEPVAKLLDVKLFGDFSIGNFFTAALFVTLAISFMRMFAGG